MDALRTGLLDQQQRQARTQYDGEPLAKYRTFYSPSLPPPADPPTKAKPSPKPPRLAHNRLTDDEARAIWCLRDAGHTKVEIARATGRSTLAVDRVLSEDRPPAPAPATSLTPRPVKVAEASPSEPDAPAPDTRPVRRSSAAPAGEPQRLHVLQWADRLSRIEFDGQPEQGKPKRGRSRGKGFTHHQVQHLLRSNHAPSIAMDINSRPKALQSIAQIFG